MTTLERFPEVPAAPEQVQPKEQTAPPEQISISTPPPGKQPATPVVASPVEQSQLAASPKEFVANIPANNQSELEAMSKGNIDQSKTWFGTYWIRGIKRALNSGIHIIFKKS